MMKARTSSSEKSGRMLEATGIDALVDTREEQDYSPLTEACVAHVDQVESRGKFAVSHWPWLHAIFASPG